MDSSWNLWLGSFWRQWSQLQLWFWDVSATSIVCSFSLCYAVLGNMHFGKKSVYVRKVKSAWTVHLYKNQILKLTTHIFCFNCLKCYWPTGLFSVTQKKEEDKGKVLMFGKMTAEEIEEISEADKQLFLGTLLLDRSDRQRSMRNKRDKIVSNMSPVSILLYCI